MGIKFNLSGKHIFMLTVPLLLVGGIFIFKSFFVENIVRYFNLNFLNRYSISDEYIRYLSIKFPEEKKINILEIAQMIPISANQENRVITVRNIEGTKIISVKKHFLSFIYLGSKKKFAEIDGNLFLEGDMISPNEKLVRIEKDRVLIISFGRKKWLYILE